jgi:hypothetical protein
MPKFHANAKAVYGVVLSFVQNYDFSMEYLERNLKFVSDKAISNVRQWRTQEFFLRGGFYKFS